MKYSLITALVLFHFMLPAYAQDQKLPTDKDTPEAPAFGSPASPPVYMQTPKPATPSSPSQPSVQQPPVASPTVTPPPTVKQPKLPPQTVPTYE